MKKDVTSFLVQCDQELNIINTFWYQPVFLISPYQKNLKDLFVDGEHGRLSFMALEAKDADEPVACDGQYLMVSPKTKISICMMRMGDKILIHGLDKEILGQGDHEAAAKAVIHQFMAVVRDSYGEIVTKDEILIREAFEEVQRLNNHLNNMKRQLQKANVQLNRANEELSNRLVKDALTGLVSRYQYRDEILGLIAKEPHQKGIFGFVDLDDFKSINDHFGHRRGDEFLKAFARRLERLPFDKLICMRISGDEFGFYIHGYEKVQKNDLDHIWAAMEEYVLSAPLVIEGTAHEVSCSVGMSVYGEDTKDIYDLIEYADFAMYEIKKSGKKNYSRFKKERYHGKKNHMM